MELSVVVIVTVVTVVAVVVVVLVTTVDAVGIVVVTVVASTLPPYISIVIPHLRDAGSSLRFHNNSWVRHCLPCCGSCTGR